jgi:hypothetical protein
MTMRSELCRFWIGVGVGTILLGLLILASGSLAAVAYEFVTALGGRETWAKISAIAVGVISAGLIITGVAWRIDHHG